MHEAIHPVFCYWMSFKLNINDLIQKRLLLYGFNAWQFLAFEKL
jgi:hypothetical protein